MKLTGYIQQPLVVTRLNFGVKGQGHSKRHPRGRWGVKETFYSFILYSFLIS